ncbi:MAG: interleukin-like EMT inducer domain-containing protein [Eubacteriales bacterium]
MKRKSAIFIKMIVFIAMLFFILQCLRYVLIPIVFQYDGYSLAASNFYEQKEDSISTVILGASHTEFSIIPMELYKNNGICAYNFSSAGQTLLLSYHRLIDAYKYQDESLDTVILNIAMLRLTDQNSNNDDIALLSMPYSENKFNIIKTKSDNLDGFIGLLFPIVSYHARWKEVTKSSFSYFSYDNSITSRGYGFSTNTVLENSTYQEISVPNYVDLSSEVMEEYESSVKESSLSYMLKIIQFCEEKNLNLVLVQTPVYYWTDELHNEVEEIAMEHEIEFYDFNYAPLIDEINYNVATDGWDAAHMNYYGALKFSEWIGNYLVAKCNAIDVRGEDEYAYMEKELRVYYQNVISTQLNDIVDLSEYIKFINQLEDFTIFIVTQDEGLNVLNETQRENLKSVGLVELSYLDYIGSYIGVIENGEVVTEKILAIDNNSVLQNDGITVDGKAYNLVSGGESNMSSININNGEYSKTESGINLVVYDNVLGEVVDSTNFDIFNSSTRMPQSIEKQLNELLKNGAELADLTGDVRQLYLYNLKCNDEYKIKQIELNIEEYNLLEYLNVFLEDNSYVVFMSVKDGLNEGFDENACFELAKLGLVELSKLEYNNSYIAILDEGNVIIEERSSEEVLQKNMFNYGIVSSGFDAETISSIVIDEVEYSPNISGINIVVYNKNTKLVVDARAFVR